jgi:hypothetical protein
MKYLLIFIAFFFYVVEDAAHKRSPSEKIHAEYLCIKDGLALSINRKQSSILENLQESMKCYLKSSSRIREQLDSARQSFTMAQTFSAIYQILTIENHINEVQSDLDRDVTRQRFNETTYKFYAITMRAAKLNFDAIIKAVDDKPELFKCWDDLRRECNGVHRDLLVKQNTAILEKNIHELNEKLRSIAKEIDDTVARIDHDLCSCTGDEAPACISQYVSKNHLLEDRQT